MNEVHGLKSVKNNKVSQLNLTYNTCTYVYTMYVYMFNSLGSRPPPFPCAF